MAGIEIITPGDVTATHPIAGHVVDGTGRFRTASPAGGSLWMVTAELDDGAVLSLPERHGDEAVYVQSGALRLDERVCPASGAVIVESGAAPMLRAVGATRIVHMGPHDPDVPTAGLNGPPLPGGDVHVVGPRGTFAAVESGRDTHYYADSTCPSCRITLLYTSRSVPYISATHSHSTDELIHLLWGELHLGSQVVRPGDTLAIDADRRYGFRSGPDGFGFLNYRRDASQQVMERGSEPRMEGGAVNGLVEVMDLVTPTSSGLV